MKLYMKFAALVASGAVLLAIGSCAGWVLDALYLLPNIIDAINSASGT